MSEIEMAHGFGDVARFFRIERAGLAFSDSAESAVARADVAREHEGRRPIRPALEDVWAFRLLTNSVQVQAFDQLEHMILIRRIAQANLQPFRLGLSRFVADDFKFACQIYYSKTLSVKLFYHLGVPIAECGFRIAD